MRPPSELVHILDISVNQPKIRKGIYSHECDQDRSNLFSTTRSNDHRACYVQVMLSTVQLDDKSGARDTDQETRCQNKQLGFTYAYLNSKEPTRYEAELMDKKCVLVSSSDVFALRVLLPSRNVQKPRPQN
jgi:hypothetical protein